MTFDVDLIGFIAAILTTASFVPQAILVWRTDDTRSISLGMYAMMTVGITLWLVYGIILQRPPLIVANAITGTLAALILYKKIRHIRIGKT